MRSNRKPYVVALERVGASTIMAAIRPTARARAIEAATEVVGTIQRNGIRVLHRHSTNNFGMPLAANHGPKRSNSDRLAGSCLTTSLCGKHLPEILNECNRLIT